MKRAAFSAAVGAAGLLAAVLPRVASAADGFVEQNLVSDGFVPAQQPADPQLKNPWGIAFTPNTPFWVADNNAGVSTIYNASFAKQGLVVTVPPPAATPTASSTPTGIVGNTDATFQLGGKTVNFIFSTEDGTIAAWQAGTNAVREVDNSTTSVYKGLAQGTTAAGGFVYATNFKTGHVDVFDHTFAPATLAGNFTDPSLPAPAAGHPGYAPFGIQNLGGNLFVTYALQDDAQHDDVHVLGNGFVDEFDTSGNFLGRVISGGQLDSPWGLAIAPAGFGALGGDLLVGNFGNSHVNAYKLGTGGSTAATFDAALTDKNGQPLSLTDAADADGLWGITFGNGLKSGDPNTLYFASGVNDEADGLLGSVSVPEPGAASLLALTAAAAWRRRLRR